MIRLAPGFVWDNGGPLHVSDFLLGVLCCMVVHAWRRGKS